MHHDTWLRILYHYVEYINYMIGKKYIVNTIFYGNIIQYLSFRKAADAGKELIQAGHKIDSEKKDSNSN